MVKCGKYSPVKFANFVLCAEKCNHISKSERIKFANFTGLYFPHFTMFCIATKLHNFTKFRMLFSAVLMNIPNLKVCSKGKSSIKARISRPRIKTELSKVDLTVHMQTFGIQHICKKTKFNANYLRKNPSSSRVFFVF